MDKSFVITIGRQFGSGGREIGKLLSEKLHVKYYDKEILMKAANSIGLNPSFFEKADERAPNFLSNLFSFNMGYNSEPYFIGSTPLSDDNIYRAQSDVMHALADESPCIIVGRSADYVLRNHHCCISVFIHASMEARIERIIRRGDCLTADEARNLAEKKNKLRSNYYNFYTNKIWGDAASYDLTIDSSKISSDAVTNIIIEYLNSRQNILI